MKRKQELTRRALFSQLGGLHGKRHRPVSRSKTQRQRQPRGKTQADQQTEDVPANRFTRRLLVMGAGQLFLFGLLASRLNSLQKIEGRRYRSMAEENRIAMRFLPSVRGRIYDRGGALIASLQENLRVSITPDKAKNVSASLDRLAREIKLERKDRERVLRTARRQNPQLPIPITAGLSWKQFARINVLGPQLPGVSTRVGWKRVYHFGEDFAHILGHLGQPDRFKLAAEPALRHTGDKVGVAGVELGFDDRLRGKPGFVEVEVNARGRLVRELKRQAPVPGEDLQLTIDQHLQAQILKRLSKFRRAAAVAMDVVSGDVVAMCSTPGFDPNLLTEPVDRREWDRLRQAPDDPMTDRATRGQYPPGSTFKMITALAGLEAGVITDKTRFRCSGHFDYHDHRFHCWNRSGHGVTDLHKALKQSCDVFFYRTVEKVGIGRLARMARLFGLGQSYDCGLPTQKPGLIPDPDWKAEQKRQGWFGGETVLAGIGQGYVLATPLQLAVMTSRIATGLEVRPRLAFPRRDEPQLPPARLPVDEKFLQLVRAGMNGVVNEKDGTATRAALGWPGLAMAGKTGTSQVRRKPKSGKAMEWKYRDHALFVAYAPYVNPRYAVSIVVEHGQSGGKVAAPVASDIMKLLLIRDPAYRMSQLRPEQLAGDKR